MAKQDAKTKQAEADRVSDKLSVRQTQRLGLLSMAMGDVRLAREMEQYVCGDDRLSAEGRLHLLAIAGGDVVRAGQMEAYVLEGERGGD